MAVIQPILEAADKIDKAKALEVYDDISYKLYSEGWADFEYKGIPLRAVIESLPEKGEK